MVAVEKAGIPAVGIVARSFVRAWQSCVEGWGQPSTAFVTIPHATTGQQADFIRTMVDDADRRRHPGSHRHCPRPWGRPAAPRAAARPPRSSRCEMDATPAGLDAVNRFLAERDWSDGLPVIPPTPAAVEQMLQGTRRQPQDVLMVMEPGFGLATVEKIAINAVMAGCRPEHFPVLLAAIDCLAQPEMNHRDMQVSGHTEAPLILVNGPIARKAGITSGPRPWARASINSANTAIGRALRLCLINIGYCKAGAGDPNFVGLPTKFGMCLAENEETSPWQPYHMDKGFKRDDSAVTVVVVTGPTTIIDSGSRAPEDTLNNIASMMFYRNAGAGGWLRGWQSAQVGHTNRRVSYPGPYHPIILSPSRAVILAEAGMSKQDAQAWLHRHCRVSLQSVLGTRGMPRDASGTWLTHPELQQLEHDPQATIPALESPEQYLLFVSGGSTHYAHFFYGTYGIATRPVEGV